MPVAIDLRPYVGTWIAQDADGEIIAFADDLDTLERSLIEERGFTEETLPAIRRVPEEGPSSFLL